MAFTQVPITGTVNLSNAIPANGAIVTFQLNTSITDGTTLIAPEPVSARCNSSGAFSVTLNANDDSTTTPTGTYYQVVITYGNQTLQSFNVIVPHADSGGVDLFALSPLTNPNTANPYVTQIQAGTNITISPTGGTGIVTVNSSGGAGNVVALGSISGTTTCNLASGTCFTGTLTGNVTINFSNWPASPALTEPLLILTQDGTGGRTITITGVIWEPTGSPPTFNTAAGSVNVIPLSSPDQGTHLYGSGASASVPTGPGFTVVEGQVHSLTPVLENKRVNVNPAQVTATNAASTLTISTPDSSGQVVEPAVEYIPGGWSGHNYWALITGYTGGSFVFENPSLYRSDDGINFTAVTTATVNGVPGTNIFPIVPEPNQTTFGAGACNADPDLVLGPDGLLHLFWLQVNQSPSTTSVYWATYDGTNLTTPTILWTSTHTTEAIIGPVFMWDGANDQWVCWNTNAANFYNSVSAPYTFNRRTCAGTTPGGTWSAPSAVTVNGPSGVSIWESHIGRRGTQLHIVSTWCQIMTGGGAPSSLYFGTSDDNGLTWNFGTTPLLTASTSGWDSGQMYRGDIVPVDDGGDTLYDLYYSAANGTTWLMGKTSITANSDPMNRVVAPVYGATMLGSTATVAANAVQLVRVFVKKSGTLRAFNYFPTNSTGNVLGAVFDTGDALAGSDTITRLWVSASTSMGATNTWQSLGDPDIQVTKGQELYLAVQFSASTPTIGRFSTFPAANAAALPSGYLTVPGGVLPKLSAIDTGPVSFAMPTTIAEASLTDSTAQPVILCVIE